VKESGPERKYLKSRMPTDGLKAFRLLKKEKMVGNED